MKKQKTLDEISLGMDSLWIFYMLCTYSLNSIRFL